jgi:hypothetical protein
METAEDKFRAGQVTVAFGIAYNKHGYWRILITCEISHTLIGHCNIFNSPSFLSSTTSRRRWFMFFWLLIHFRHVLLHCFRRLLTYGRHLYIGGILLRASHHCFALTCVFINSSVGICAYISYSDCRPLYNRAAVSSLRPATQSDLGRDYEIVEPYFNSSFNL